MNPSTAPTSSWLRQAIGLIEADYLRSADTHLIPLLLCDAGERYLPNYHCAAWVEETFGNCTSAEQWVCHAMAAGQTC